MTWLVAKEPACAVDALKDARGLNMSEQNNLFTSFTTDFDQAAAGATSFSGDFKRRREAWPISKFRKGASGQEELRVRILPLPTVISKGYWIRTKSGKSYWSDSPAWDPATSTSNGPDPVAECLPTTKSTSKYVGYAIDTLHLAQLQQMGIGPERYIPYVEGQQMIMHPYRVVEISNALMQQINIIRGMKGNASDPTTGYILNIVKLDKNGKVEYQVVPGDAFPVDPSMLQDLARMAMPDIRQYHEPEPLHEIVKSLYFNGHADFNKATEMLERYKNMGKITQDEIAVALKGMNTYAEKHGGQSVATGMALPAPGLPAPGLPTPGLPQMAAPAMPTAPAFPSMPAPIAALPQAPVAPPAPAAPAFPAFNMPQAPAAPQAAAPAIPGIPSAPAIPGIPQIPGIPGIPTPAIPGIPSAPVATPPGLLD